MVKKPPIVEDKVKAAVDDAYDRLSGIKKPAGQCDNGGRWYPDDDERGPCCNSIRTPSRAWPWNYFKHCHTFKHIACRHGMKTSELKKAMVNRAPLYMNSHPSMVKEILSKK